MMNTQRSKILRYLGTLGAIVLIAPLLVACSKPLPVSIHGVNYTVEPFSYVLTDPSDPKNTIGGELIESTQLAARCAAMNWRGNGSRG